MRLDTFRIDEEYHPTNRAANRLLRRDDNAFLLVLIFNQNIQNERAWEVPLRLRGRLSRLRKNVC